MKINFPLLTAVLSANIVCLIVGGAYSYTSPVIPKLKSTTDNPLDRPITSFEQSWITSLLSLGAAIGPLLARPLLNRFGKKKILLSIAAPMIISYLIMAVGTRVEYFFIGRFLLGLGVGCVFSIIPAYVGEISENSNRGALGCVFSTLATTGSLLTFCIGPFVSVQVFNFLFLIPLVLFVILFPIFAPESPYDLIDNEEEARKCLSRIRLADSSIGKEIEEIKYSVQGFDGQATFMDLFRSKEISRGLLIVCGLMFFQQFSGITVIVSNLQSIFEASGSKIQPEVSAIVIGVIQVFSNLIASQLVDRAGRRLLVIISLVGMFISNLSLATFFLLKSQGFEDLVNAIFWIPIISLILYVLMFTAGIGPVAWVMTGELFSPKYKSIATTSVSTFCLFQAFILTAFFPNLVEIIGMTGTFWIFTGSCGLGIAFAAVFVPETKGKSLQEIQTMLAGIIKS